MPEKGITEKCISGACFGVRYITRDELRQAMTDYGMGDEATIDEILDDVDTDKVSLSLSLYVAWSLMTLSVVFYANWFTNFYMNKCRMEQSIMQNL